MQLVILEVNSLFNSKALEEIVLVLKTNMLQLVNID